ncbi:hypothetical protein GCM10018781_77690 [Kitasatospora indigofera]|uniref:Uncharacterized protein n=1 Tax=Kitasatospora indigofera TaxID=67307 RepID=A0A918YV92_9ACTN|nr:hypothetical protein GCM10018781_77690 [Kitasatospora indigofera]
MLAMAVAEEELALAPGGRGVRDGALGRLGGGALPVGFGTLPHEGSVAVPYWAPTPS